jgi:cytochrome c peroxidase
MSAAKVELGRRLFYDADLSIDGTMSCATCHEQHRAFADGNRTRPGVHGDAGRRNVPGLTNVAWASKLTWADPRLTTLEAQAAVPVMGEHPIEMGMAGKEPEIARRLGRDGCYPRMFKAAFPEAEGRIDMATVAKAVAAFERTLISFDAPYDRYRRGRIDAMPPTARRGEALFHGRAACAGCHAGANFTDGNYHALDRPNGNGIDIGLGEVTGLEPDNGRFRTPGLRNVQLTTPYMHDGAATSLADAIDRHQLVVPVLSSLSADEKAELSAFLAQLTDAKFVADDRFGHPRKACGRKL